MIITIDTEKKDEINVLFKILPQCRNEEELKTKLIAFELAKLMKVFESLWKKSFIP